MVIIWTFIFFCPAHFIFFFIRFLVLVLLLLVLRCFIFWGDALLCDSSPSSDFEWFLLGLIYSLWVTSLALADIPWVKKVVNLSFKGDDDLACDFTHSTSVFDVSLADGSGGGGCACGGGGGDDDDSAPIPAATASAPTHATTAAAPAPGATASAAPLWHAWGFFTMVLLATFCSLSVSSSWMEPSWWLDNYDAACCTSMQCGVVCTLAAITLTLPWGISVFSCFGEFCLSSCSSTQSCSCISDRSIWDCTLSVSGLSIANWLVKDENGSLEVESERPWVISEFSWFGEFCSFWGGLKSSSWFFHTIMQMQISDWSICGCAHYLCQALSTAGLIGKRWKCLHWSWIRNRGLICGVLLMWSGIFIFRWGVVSSLVVGAVHTACLGAVGGGGSGHHHSSPCMVRTMRWKAVFHPFYPFLHHPVVVSWDSLSTHLWWIFLSYGHISWLKLLVHCHNAHDGQSVNNRRYYILFSNQNWNWKK